MVKSYGVSICCQFHGSGLCSGLRDDFLVKSLVSTHVDILCFLVMQPGDVQGHVFPMESLVAAYLAVVRLFPNVLHHVKGHELGVSERLVTPPAVGPGLGVQYLDVVFTL